jgi:hypothetical protein
VYTPDATAPKIALPNKTASLKAVQYFTQVTEAGEDLTNVIEERRTAHVGGTLCSQ